MRVMTWNLWWQFGPWEKRQNAIGTVIESEAPDVIFLQEVWSDGNDSAAHRLAARFRMHAVLSDDPFAEERRLGTSKHGNVGFHNAILSRWPLVDPVSVPLPAADGRPGHRRAVAATVDAPTGRWPVVCTHFDYRFDESAARVRQATRVLQLIAERRNDPENGPPTILGADCNAVPDSDEIRLLTGRTAAPVPNLVLSDVWEQCGEGRGVTWRSDNPYRADTAWPDRRLDYVFVSWPRPKPLGNPQRAWMAGLGPVDGVWPSDHAAVVVDLRDS